MDHFKRLSLHVEDEEIRKEIRELLLSYCNQTSEAALILFFILTISYGIGAEDGIKNHMALAQIYFVSTLWSIMWNIVKYIPRFRFLSGYVCWSMVFMQTLMTALALAQKLPYQDEIDVQTIEQI